MNQSHLNFPDLAKLGFGGLAYMKGAAYIFIFYFVFSFFSAALATASTGHSLWLQSAFLLLGYYGLLWGIYFAVAHVHRRPAVHAFTGEARFRFGLMYKSFAVFFALCAVSDVVNFLSFGGQYVWNFSWSNFIPVLCIGIFVVPIQTTAEELLIRSYLLQGLSLWIPNRWAVIASTALIFALLHGGNVEISYFGWVRMTAYYFCFGIFLGAITVASNGLEMAMGIHAAVNMYSFCFVGFEGSSLPSETVFKLLSPNVDVMLMLSLGCIIAYSVILKKSFDYKYFKRSL